VKNRGLKIKIMAIILIWSFSLLGCSQSMNQEEALKGVISSVANKSSYEEYKKECEKYKNEDVQKYEVINYIYMSLNGYAPRNVNVDLKYSDKNFNKYEYNYIEAEVTVIDRNNSNHKVLLAFRLDDKNKVIACKTWN